MSRRRDKPDTVTRPCCLVAVGLTAFYRDGSTMFQHRKTCR